MFVISRKCRAPGEQLLHVLVSVRDEGRTNILLRKMQRGREETKVRFVDWRYRAVGLRPLRTLRKYIRYDTLSMVYKIIRETL